MRPVALPPRLILLHKQATSGRVRFLCLGESILAFSPLPDLAALRPEDQHQPTRLHPAGPLQEAEKRLKLPPDSLVAEAEFEAWVDTPAGDVPILLAHFSHIDPPFAAAEAAGGRFISLTETRQFPDIERHLLRRAYEHVLG